MIILLMLPVLLIVIGIMNKNTNEKEIDNADESFNVIYHK